MLPFLILFVLLITSYSLIFGKLHPGVSALVVILSFALGIYLWTMPRIYLFGNHQGLGEPDSGGGPIVINYEGKSLTYNLPFTMGDVDNVGKLTACIVGFTLMAGALLGMKLREAKG